MLKLDWLIVQVKRRSSYRVRSCYPEMTNTVWTGHRLKRRCKPTSKAAKPARAAMQRDAPVRTGPVTRSMASRTSEH